LQRLILGFGQFYDTLHRYPGVMTTPKVNKIQTRLPATLKTINPSCTVYITCEV
jgi:hypothetical protein